MSDFLERNGLQTVAQHFKDLFLASVYRDGAEELLERLENEKITCSECGRRRFGITYEVTGRATRKKEVTKK